MSSRTPEERPTFVDICRELLEYANDRFMQESFITSEQGQAVLDRMDGEGIVHKSMSMTLSAKFH